MPEEDRFVVVSEHPKANSSSATYLDIARSDDLVIIRITANNTRTVEQKQALFAGIAGISKWLAIWPAGKKKEKLVVRQRHRAICLKHPMKLRTRWHRRVWRIQ